MPILTPSTFRGALLALFAALALSFPVLAQDIIVDNDAGPPAYEETGEWLVSATPGYNGGAYRYVLGPDGDPSATWTATVPADGFYQVSALILKSGNRTQAAPYTITHAGGETTVTRTQLGSLGMGEVPLGTYRFEAATPAVIRLGAGETGATISDAIVLRPAGEAPTEWRCIWVDSWNVSFLNQAQADDLLATARASNINTLIVEVRKIGDAYYDSALEPRATNISGGQSFDPLAYLVEKAHDTSGGQPYVQIHAWFVMHRISRGETLNPQHILVRHPEYVMSNAAGETSASGTTFLDPGHPGTVEHNIAVILDCMSKYDIDGVNLDYIRYPEYTGSWGYNPVSVARFNAAHNRTGQPAGSDAQWANWRRDMVRGEVRKLYVKMAQLKPHVVLTTCTVQWGTTGFANYPSSAPYAQVFQDWVGWLREGIIDYNALMNYATDDTRYQGWTNLSLANDDIRGSIIGIGAYLQPTIQDSMDQLLWTREQGAGLNIYDWGSEVQGASGATRAQFYQELRNQVFTEWVDPPKPAWKANPTKGMFEGNLTYFGDPVDWGEVTLVNLDDRVQRTDGMGWYGHLEVPPGTYEIRFSKPGVGVGEVTKVAAVEAGQIITVNADLGVVPEEQVNTWMLR